MEGWHGVLKRSDGANHSTIFKFLLSLQQEQKFQELRMAKIDSGHPVEIVPRKYRLLNERLVKTAKKYSSATDFDCINYLNTLAFNIHF